MIPAPTFFWDGAQVGSSTVDGLDMCPLQRPAPLKNNNGVSDAHLAKLERLRRALSNGTYRPQAQLIAARMLTSGDLA